MNMVLEDDIMGLKKTIKAYPVGNKANGQISK